MGSALENFYDVHQRSQLTGVPTSEYNAALAAAGFSPGEGSKATSALQAAGFETGAPSQSYIDKYGSQIAEQGYGNMAYASKTPNNTTASASFEPASFEKASFNLGMLGMGDAPQKAYEQMLSGKANTETLDPVVNSAMRRMSDNFNEQVMPSINHGAVASGQYGGSRQGIAQGLAAKGLAQSQGDTAGSMYNNAYNNAQGLMGSAASQLGGIAGQYGLSNAQMNNQTNQFNAGQQNNMSQFLSNNDLNWANYDLGMNNSNNNWALQGANLMNNTYAAMNNANNNAYDAANTAYKEPYNQWSNFTNTANQVGSGYPSASSSMPGNPVMGALGGAQLGNQFSSWMKT